jgi:hypothetical protein
MTRGISDPYALHDFYQGKRSGGSRNKRQTTAEDRGIQQTRSDVLDLLGRQERITEENRLLSESDRQTAISTLQNRIGQRSADYELTRDALLEDPGETPFAAMLRSSIQSTLDRPDVYSPDQVADFKARAHDAAGRAVQDAIRTTRISNAQRGVEGGIPQGEVQDLQLQATSEATRQAGEIEFAAAEARAQNLAAAQALGVNFETATMNARTSRLASLSQLVSQEETRDLELITGVAEILANTVRQNPDYSGYAAIVQDINQASLDLLSQRENLALLEEQLKVQERLGMADLDLQREMGNASLQFNMQLMQLTQQIRNLEADLDDERNKNRNQEQ